MFVDDLAGANHHVVLYDLYERMLHNEDLFDSRVTYLQRHKLLKATSRFSERFDIRRIYRAAAIYELNSPSCAPRN